MVVFPFDLVLGLGPVVPLVWGWDGVLDLVVLVAARVVLFKGRDQIVLLELELTSVRQVGQFQAPDSRVNAGWEGNPVRAGFLDPD